MYMGYPALTFIKSCNFFAFDLKFFLQKFCRFEKKQYLCTRFREKIKRWH